jgi:hypothetical protein
MRILLKCPTRSRPQRVTATLTEYMKLANHPEQIGVAVSCDEDDTSMERNLVQEELHKVLSKSEWHRIFFSRNKSKIEACNANMNEIEYPWDIVVLVSDDMIPQIKGYDDVIRNHMRSRFPNTDGLLWFNDGTQGNNLNTLCIYGRELYKSFGYIYNPEYKSLFCDTELTDLCRTTLASKCLYVPYCIIRHQHPGTGYPQLMDALYNANQRYWSQDMYTYISRKNYQYDWSILIPTMTGRELKLQILLENIHEKIRRICPSLRYEICLAFDNRETSVGMKRQKLLQEAKGKYMSFIDDDDYITDNYIQDMFDTFQGGYHVMRLRGQIGKYTFTHSLENQLSNFMAKDDVFLRPPNHLNVIMTDVAKLIHFGDATRGEDLDWSLKLARSGFLTKEYQPDFNRIHYIYNISSLSELDATIDFQRVTSYETMLKVVWSSNGASLPVAEPVKKTLRLGMNGFVSK